MLVRQHLKGWKIISHYAHALLAGKIGNQINESLRRTHWPETLTAIINHDDNMLDFDTSDYLTDAGTPRDFTMDGGHKKDSVNHTKTLYSETVQKLQWISLLVSRHLEFLYQDSTDKEIQQFISEMYEKRKKQRKLYGINLDDENHLYSLIRFCDRLSLILCGDEVPPSGRILEINTSKKMKPISFRGRKHLSSKYHLGFFQEDKFELECEYKILGQTKFNSNSELKKCIINASIKTNTLPLS